MKSTGLFDLQVNGYAGVDFNSVELTAEGLDHALSEMLLSGVTGCLPTLVTAHQDELRARFIALDKAVNESRLGPSMVPGYHLEGPFLNPTSGYLGCHPADAMTDPSTAVVEMLERGLIRPILIVSLAPERKGSASVIRSLTASGKMVAVGHSAAGYDDISNAAQAGMTLSTHLGNGLPKTLPKLENTLLAQLAERRLTACLIADGHHMSKQALRALIDLKKAENCILVTDAVVAAAAPSGSYKFAGMDVESLQDGKVIRPGETGLAGSALKLDVAIRNVIDWEIADLKTAISMASDRARTAIAPALIAHGISLSSGELSWDTDVRPTVVQPGHVHLT